MKFKTKFHAFGRNYDLTLDTCDCARDYVDEDYAYWIEEDRERYFEVNIWKENGRFTMSGGVFCYSSLEAFVGGGAPCEEHDITFVCAGA